MSYLNDELLKIEKKVAQTEQQMSDFLKRQAENKAREQAEFDRLNRQIDGLKLSAPVTKLLKALVDPPCCECCDSKVSVQDLLTDALREMKEEAE